MGGRRPIVHVAILLGITVLTEAHPSSKSFPGSRTKADPDLPTINSYHIHVQYLNGTTDSTARAMEFRAAFMKEFGNTTCDGLFEQPDVCMYEIEYHPGGIFVSGNWAAYLPLPRYQEIVSWSAQHRGDLDILFHPNSDNYIHDHFRWSTWLGRPWPLNVEAFSDYPLPNDEYCNMWQCYYGSPGGW